MTIISYASILIHGNNLILMAMLTRTVALKWDIPPACHEYSVPGIGMCPPFGQKSMCPSYKSVIVILKHARLYISVYMIPYVVIILRSHAT